MLLLRAFLYKLLKGFSPCPLTTEQEMRIRKTVYQVILRHTLQMNSRHPLVKQNRLAVDKTVRKLCRPRTAFLLFMYLFHVRAVVTVVQLESIISILLESTLFVDWLADRCLL